ncbi:helix-turn-helix domain-containing protein [Piscibacillus sp. B03]|uniref:helix-turn-helix domain-containing protein n=1 Tax=Piscibacillus sp. B03 TaxID=3457430 RepID=UPI003FCE00D0
MNQNTLKLARVLVGFSQLELAEKLGINQATLSRYEQGKLNISSEIKTKLIQVLAEHGLGQEDIYLLGDLKR